mmetsp:Transcript_35581/g.46826  ORF Transcript_35581/g.46826 Transcript_35581/m.46826 type:complete len:98 (+) Transcript_35581:464-757(+)
MQDEVRIEPTFEDNMLGEAQLLKQLLHDYYIISEKQDKTKEQMYHLKALTAQALKFQSFFLRGFTHKCYESLQAMAKEGQKDAQKAAKKDAKKLKLK